MFLTIWKSPLMICGASASVAPCAQFVGVSMRYAVVRAYRRTQRRALSARRQTILGQFRVSR